MIFRITVYRHGANPIIMPHGHQAVTVAGTLHVWAKMPARSMVIWEMLHVIDGVSRVWWGIGRLSCISAAEVPRQPLCHSLLCGDLPVGCIPGYGSTRILKGGSLGLPCKPPRTGWGKDHEHNQKSENRHLPKRLLWSPDAVQDPSNCQLGNSDASEWSSAFFAKVLIPTQWHRASP